MSLEVRENVNLSQALMTRRTNNLTDRPVQYVATVTTDLSLLKGFGAMCCSAVLSHVRNC